MSSKFRRFAILSINPWLTVALTLVIGAVGFESIWNFNTPPCVFPEKIYSNAIEMVYRNLSDINNFLVGLALFVLSGLGFFMRTLRTIPNERVRIHSRNALYVSGTFLVASLYFSYIGKVAISTAEMNFCKDFNRTLIVPHLLQFLSIITGSLSAMSLVYRFLNFDRINDS